jgi:hypothetical protein
VATKPFNISYRINKPNGFILVNGDQITKIEATKIANEWQVVFHLSDGSSHKLKRAWSTKFVKETLGETKSKPKT